MPDNRIVKWGGIAIVVLVLANIVSYFYNNWGLITVKVTDAPLGKVIKSIEWQGWVKIYTNLPLDSKVSMYVDHVPLAEAMETLAANVSGPPNGADNGGFQGNRPAGAQANGGPGTNAPSGTPPGPPGGPGGFAGGGPGGGPGGPGGGGPPGGRQGRGGGRDFGATWNLAFFVAPTSSQVKQEISAFEAGTPDDDMRVYTYSTPLQMLATDDDMPAADPRKQAWPGYKAPDPAPTPPPPADGQTPASATAPATPAPDAAPTVQTYLRAFAESSNIWIMTPGSWTADASTPPPADSSIIRAVKNFVGNAHGAVTEAIVLRMGRGAHGAPGGNRGGGGFGDIAASEDRIRNAISGLPEDAQADALAQLDQEVQFFQQVKLAPPDQQMDMIRNHMMAKMSNGNNRRSPEKRAERYARAVSNRQAAQGKK